MFEPILPLLGLIVGFLVGLTGIGGGSLMTPLLMFLGVPPIIAVGSDLTYNAATKAVGTLLHASKRNIEYTLLKRLVLGSIPALIGGYFLVSFIRSNFGWSALNYVIGILVATVLIFTGTIHFISSRNRFSNPQDDPPTTINATNGVSATAVSYTHLTLPTTPYV